LQRRGDEPENVDHRRVRTVVRDGRVFAAAQHGLAAGMRTWHPGGAALVGHLLATFALFSRELGVGHETGESWHTCDHNRKQDDRERSQESHDAILQHAIGGPRDHPTQRRPRWVGEAGKAADAAEANRQGHG
jgi:hypothetical protein